MEQILEIKTEQQEKRSATKQQLQEIKSLLPKLKLLKVEKQIRCGEYLQQIAKLQEQIETLCKPIDEVEAEIMAQIRRIMPDIGVSVRTNDGMISYRKGAIRGTYPVKDVDAFLDDHPEIAEKIRPFKKLTQIKDSVTVEVY